MMTRKQSKQHVVASYVNVRVSHFQFRRLLIQHMSCSTLICPGAPHPTIPVMSGLWISKMKWKIANILAVK